MNNRTAADFDTKLLTPHERLVEAERQPAACAQRTACHHRPRERELVIAVRDGLRGAGDTITE